MHFSSRFVTIFIKGGERCWPTLSRGLDGKAQGSTVPRTVPLAWRKRGRDFFSSGRIRDVDTRGTQSLRRSRAGDMVTAHRINSQVFI